VVELAGGSKSTVYSEFGGKCGLFINSIETLCRQSNEPLAKLDYTGLNLEQSLKKTRLPHPEAHHGKALGGSSSARHRRSSELP